MNFFVRVKNKVKKELFRDCKTIIVASGQKVGSTWLFDVLNSLNYFNIRNIDYYSSDLVKGKGGLKLGPGLETYEFLTSQYHATVIKTHNAPPTDWQPDKKIGIVSIYRDPRDVIVSTINYLSWLPVDQGGWGKEFSEKGFKDKYFQFMETNWHLGLLENWHFDKIAYKVSYEALLENPFDELVRLLTFYNVPYKASELKFIVEKNNFEYQKIKAIEQNDQKRIKFLSKGKAKQWELLFDEEMKEKFKSNERWNRLLIEQGYEVNNNW
jgi:hypothetical protein